jgi:hypothetical protein
MEHYTAEIPVAQMGGYSNLQLVKDPAAEAKAKASIKK